MKERIRVVLVDDAAPVREELRKSFEVAPEIVVAGETSNGAAALPLIESLQPDVTMLDCRLPGLSGVQVAVTLKQMCVPTNVLACSAYDDEDCVRGMVDAGAMGYVLKNEPPEKIVEAVRATAQGKEWFSQSIAVRFAEWLRLEKSEPAKLTKRELDVLRLLARGKKNSQIATELCISTRTLRFHFENIYAKLGIHSNREAMLWAIEHQLGKPLGQPGKTGR